jgi:hypothetical protein
MWVHQLDAGHITENKQALLPLLLCALQTTLTEKLLLFGGAIHEAGEVKARRASRHATSDWMELGG